MDFDKLAAGEPDVDPKDPLALYATLDTQHTHVELRPGQQQLLVSWAARRDERDIVLKLATGAGKTTVGLVVLYSHMRETGLPCMFLCPTNQLVQQVVQEAQRCGVAAVAVLGGDEIPPEALAGSAVVVTSVQSIFQARAGRFERAGFHVILIDDAHAAVGIVRQQLRIEVPSNDPLYAKLHALFATALREQSRGSADEIENRHGVGALEVPYWVWSEHLDAVTSLLGARAKEEDAQYRSHRAGGGGASRSPMSALPLAWGLLKNVLHGCRCIFAAKKLEIAPEVPPVELVKTYNNAKHRIFMSATLSDDSILVREMGCSEVAAARPVELADAGGLGERMVLIPRLMTGRPSTSIKWDELAELCKKVAEKKAVVVITPSTPAARKWAQVGASVVEKSSDVPAAVAALRGGTARFVVFANRYDGLDLPDEACRLLVLDGLPVAYALTDTIDMASSGGGAVRRRTVVHRVEQGLGRAVRSPSDFAVVLLFGNDLVELISMNTTRRDFTEQTRKQIEFGIEIAKAVRESGDWRSEIETLMWQCLNRDPGWKKVYQQRTKLPLNRPPADDQSVGIAQALAERRAWNEHLANRGTDAAATLRGFLNGHSPPEDTQAFLLQRVAWYLRKDDAAGSLAVQTRARELDPSLLMPSSGVKYRKGGSAVGPSAARFVDWTNQFEHPNGAVAAIEVLRARLTFAPEASHELFEQALAELGKILGFESRRPDKEIGDGPDVLWLEGQLAVPLEAKNRTSSDSTGIAKHVAAQLMQAEAWTRKVYTERSQIVPVSVHPIATCGEHAIMPEGSRVFTHVIVTGILDALQNVVGSLLRVGGSVAADVAARKLSEAGLTLSALVNRGAKPSPFPAGRG